MSVNGLLGHERLGTYRKMGEEEDVGSRKSYCRGRSMNVKVIDHKKFVDCGRLMFVKPDVGSSGFQKHLDNSKVQYLVSKADL